ncbi:MAG TPA: glutamate-cysteine ligase family protein [Candidatus Eremiobacteraceae bacterium]|nr:glutamate-cysteine ligase family protein [Candidatus Eremiobacteraceae bacterium]
MSDILADSSTPFLASPLGETSVEAAAEFLRAGAKPRAAWSSGLELELIGFTAPDSQRISPAQVRSVLERLAPDPSKWELEGDDIVAVAIPSGRITLEPGGQIEFSGNARATLHEIEADLRAYLADLVAIGDELGLYFLAIGFDPLRRLDEQKWIHKRRYTVMKPYLRSRGARAWDMMTRTASIQTSIDYSDEVDLGKKFVLGNRLGPIVAAMFANSPFADGVATGRKSERYAAWLETDPDRSGVHSSALSPKFSLEAFVERVFSTPLIFVDRNGQFEPGDGRTLRKLRGATMADFTDALSTIFTEARIRPGYVEMRSADCGPAEDALALIAFWKGLTWDSATLDAALDIAPMLSAKEFVDLQTDVAARGLEARAHGVGVLGVARDVGALAVQGLNCVAKDEAHYLDALNERIVAVGSPVVIPLKAAPSELSRLVDMRRLR